MAKICIVSPLSILLGCLVELLSLLREGLLERSVAYLLQEEVAELAPIRLLRVEHERILALLLEKWIVVPEVPVTALYGLLADSLSASHTALDTMIDTRCVGDDERWARISLGLLQYVEELCLRCSNRHLSNIYIAVGHCDSAQILLADALTHRCELSNCTYRGRLRRLTAGVRVNLGIYNEDIHILTRSQDVVYTTEADIVAPTVTTDDPLRLLNEEVFLCENLDRKSVV